MNKKYLILTVVAIVLYICYKNRQDEENEAAAGNGAGTSIYFNDRPTAGTSKAQVPDNNLVDSDSYLNTGKGRVENRYSLIV